MNLILVDKNDLERENIARLKDRRLIHIRDILKVKKGGRLSVGLVNGLMGEGEVRAVLQNYVELSLDLFQKPPAKVPVTVIFALARPPVLKRILLTLTSLGVEQIHIIHSARVEKSYWNSPVLSAENIREQLILGLEQAKDTVLPQVSFHKRFKPFVEDVLPDIISRKKAYVAHPQENRKCPPAFKGKTVLMIGPEGGFVPYEIELLLSQGVKAVSLGERIIKVETAAALLIGRCS